MRVGAFFEAKVASELAEFMQRYDEQRDGFWTPRSMAASKAPLPSTEYTWHTRGRTSGGSSCPMRSAGKEWASDSYTLP